MKLAIAVLVFLVAQCAAKMNLKRSFPAVNEHGMQLANEYQVIHPENVKNRAHAHRLGKEYAEGDFTIDEISPLNINNDEVVTVRFTAKTPTAKDWIGAFSPPDVDITKTVPVKYGWCDDDDSYLEDGTGYLTFNMTNLRADVKFYYFTNSTYSPVIVDDTAPLLSFKNINEPLRPRTVPTGDPDIFTLVWSSATSKTPVMKWGVASGDYTNTVEAVTDTIEESEMCGEPANTIGWRELGLIHHANFSGMLALSDSKIFYTFGDADTDDFSREYEFNVPPKAGQQPATRGTRVVLFDDLGRGSTDMTFTWYEYGRPAIYTTMAVGAEVAAGMVDAIYHGGDISYATGFTAVWDFFLDMLTPMSASVLYLTTVGNHETDWPDTASIYNVTDSGGECGVLTTRLVPMPYPAQTNAPWWSYDVGIIHMIGMSTEHDFTVGSPQYLWLEADLKAVDRSTTPWIIFGGHRAMYLNSDYGGSPTSDIVVMDNLIANIEPLLFQYKVNIGFYGHNHVVQRHSAVYNKTVVQAATVVYDEDFNEVNVHDDPQATVHFVVGTGGASFTKNYVTPYPEWNEMVMYEYGYARVEAVNATYLSWEWVNSQTMEIRDRVVFKQADPAAGQPWVI